MKYFFVGTIGRRSASMYYITQALKGEFLEKPFETVDEVEINYYDIKTTTDFWHVRAQKQIKNLQNQIFAVHRNFIVKHFLW